MKGLSTFKGKIMYIRIPKTGRITIPKKFRQLLNIEKGGSIFFKVESGEVRLFGIPETTAEQLAGSLKQYAGEYVSLKEIRKRI